MEGTTVRYNGKQLRWDMPADKWEEVLRPRSRQDKDIYIWDQIGVFLMQSSARRIPLAKLHSQTYTHKKKIESFSVLLGRKRHSPITTTEPDFWPKQTFSGKLIVDGALIHKNSTVNENNHDKKGTFFNRRHLPTIYAYYLGDDIGLEFGYDQTLTSSMLPSKQPFWQPRKLRKPKKHSNA